MNIPALLLACDVSIKQSGASYELWQGQSRLKKFTQVGANIRIDLPYTSDVRFKTVINQKLTQDYVMLHALEVCEIAVHASQGQLQRQLDRRARAAVAQ